MNEHFIFKQREIRAMALLASRDESRWAINGVRFEAAAGQKPLAISTDGRVLAVLESEYATDADAAFTIRRDVFDLLPPAEQFQASVNGGGLVIQSLDKNKQLPSLNFAKGQGLIESAYPNYRSVLQQAPLKRTDEPVSFSGFYYKVLARFCEAFDEDLSLIFIFNGEFNPIQLRISKRDDFFALLMPMRVDGHLESDLFRRLSATP